VKRKKARPSWSRLFSQVISPKELQHIPRHGELIFLRAPIPGSALARSRTSSEFVDQVHAEEQLISGFSIVVSRKVPRVIEAQFRPEHNSTSDVLCKIQRVFRVFRGYPSTLTLLVVEKVRAESDHQLRIQLAI
jgi:hypothetical protein